MARRRGRLTRVAGWLLAVALVVVVSCDAPGTHPQPSPTHKPTPRASPSPTPPVPSPSPSPTPSPEPSPQLSIFVTGSEYGDVAATTMSGATCSASVTMPDGGRMDLGSQTANQQGAVGWSYPAKSPAPFGRGFHTVSCSLGGKTASTFAYFEIGA